MSTDGAPVQFVPFMSYTDVGFWVKYAGRKVEIDKLDERSLNLLGLYSTSARSEIPPRVTLSSDYSYSISSAPGPVSVPVAVHFRNYNTREQFLAAPFADWTRDLAARAWAALLSGRALLAPSLLTPVGLFAFANLKTNVFYYRTLFLALKPRLQKLSYVPAPATDGPAAHAAPLSGTLKPAEFSALLTAIAGLQSTAPGAAAAAAPAAFVVFADAAGEPAAAPLAALATVPLTDADAPAWAAPLRAAVAAAAGPNAAATARGLPHFALAFTDPSAGGAPGMPLLSVLALASFFLPAPLLQRLSVVCYRDAPLAARRLAAAAPVDADAAAAELAAARSQLLTITASAPWSEDLTAFVRARAAVVALPLLAAAPDAAAAALTFARAATAATSAESAARRLEPTPLTDVAAVDIAADEAAALAATLSAVGVGNGAGGGDISAAALAEAAARWADEVAESTMWETDDQGRQRPRALDLNNHLDRRRIMQTSADLNLKLIKWRLLPQLDLERIAQTKVLLLGSGTLGCNVARALLAWGIRDFTFLDNGRVSPSNPVRQSLFTAADVAGGGRQKALAAALGLKAILPSVTARAIGLAIPMPGHGAGTAPLPAGGAPPTRLVPVPSLAAAAGGPGAPEPAEEDCVPFTEWPDNAAAAAAALRTLVSTADVVFLLTDSRESRWLPTLLCQVEDKLCVNAAMGFDSFVVMRHGARALADDGASVDWASSPHLGCYFCADIVTPANSLRDRSLDQQCTVTRPGLSMATSALAAELAVALTQHKRGLRAPALACGAGAAAGAEAARDDDDDGSATNGLGAVPQQLRGSLFSMTQTAMRAEAHDACCACGARVVGEYRARGAEFVAKVLVDAQFLDEFSGLAAIRRAAEEAAAKWDLSDEEAGGEGDGSDDDFGFE